MSQSYRLQQNINNTFNTKVNKVKKFSKYLLFNYSLQLNLKNKIEYKYVLIVLVFSKHSFYISISHFPRGLKLGVMIENLLKINK